MQLSTVRRAQGEHGISNVDRDVILGSLLQISDIDRFHGVVNVRSKVMSVKLVIDERSAIALEERHRTSGFARCGGFGGGACRRRSIHKDYIDV